MQGKQKGLYLAIEGIDGLGKTTLHEQMVATLRMKLGATQVLSVSEPTSGAVGDFLRSILRGEKESLREAGVLSLLFAADRMSWQHQKNLRKLLDEGVVVIADRSAITSHAYQGTERYHVVNSANEHVIYPDAVIYLDASVDVAFDRLARRGGTASIFEEVKPIIEKHRQGYERFFSDMGSDLLVARIDARKTPDEVLHDAMQATDALLATRKWWSSGNEPERFVGVPA